MTENRRAFLKRLIVGSKPAEEVGTLVCVFLRGGADTLNMFVPYGDDDYYASRPNIGIKKPQKGVADTAIKVTDFYAFHPKLAPLVPLFHDGRIGIVQSVGSDNPSGSHFEAQDQIEHGVACGQAYSGGWLGRHLQSLSSTAASPLVAVSLGATVPESLRGAPSASALTSLDTIKLESPSDNPQHVARVLAKLYDCEVGLLKQPGKDTLELLTRVESIRDHKVVSKAIYPKGEFGDAMREVARLINANVGVEIACVDLNGWDTHFFQGSMEGLQADLIRQLADGLAAFDSDLQSSRRNNVTVLVQTEFGRRTYENGSLGTDHGRGFALMAIGNKINGGTIHGAWPGFTKQAKDVLGPAGLTINYDYRSVLAELLVAVSGTRHINKVFPNFTPSQVGIAKPGTPLA